MSGSLPRPARPGRPSVNPPTTALPALPNSRTRKSGGLGMSSPDGSRSTTNLPSLMTSTSASPHSSSNNTTPSTATPGGAQGEDETGTKSASTTPKTADDKGIRRTVSIAAFPQPPKAASRLSSLPSSPLSRSTLPTTSSASGTASAASSRRKTATNVRRSSSDNKGSNERNGVKSSKRARPSTAGGSLRGYGGGRTSILSGLGDGKSVGLRGSDGLLNMPSPPPSRSSSAQEGSVSTSATTFDDSGDNSPQTLERDGTRRSNKPKEGKGNVVVSVRVRPDAAGDNPNPEGEWMVDGRKSLVSYRGREGGDYYYDNVFTAHDKNAKVYDASAKRLVRRVMEGYHGTVFAYGMTGTGKTFSMQGTTTSPGVIPLAITDIFAYIRETPHREFLLRVSYLEIYNEKIHDLLSISGGGDVSNASVPQEEIKLREDPKRGVYATPLKEEIVQSPTQLLRVIARGDHARRTSSTQWNARSSRSHAVVQIVVESRERNVSASGCGAPAGGPARDKRSAIVPGGVRVSTLSLIDLAGSEKAAESKERRTEGAHINKSLLTLGTVISRLSGETEKGANAADKDRKHLPYRDSKLTRLLQGALQGNSLVSILCTIQIGSAGSVAHATAHTGETINTLKFAARAKNNIVSHAQRAEEAYSGGGGDAGSRVLLERYRMEIQDLRGELEKQVKSKIEEEEKALEREEEQRREEQMLEMQLARTALKERIEHLNRLILSSKSIGVNSSGSLSALGIHARGAGERSARSSTGQGMSGDAGNEEHSLVRTASMGSIASAPPTAAGGLQGHIASPQIETNRDDEDSIGENGDGTATLSVQVRALQADLVDRNRYISTLEKRLLQARRSSHPRGSLVTTHRPIEEDGEDGDAHQKLREKDAEIAELRARLDDKDRMVAALRSAARKRDVADSPDADKKSPRFSPRSPRSPPEQPTVTVQDEGEKRTLKPARRSITSRHKTRSGGGSGGSRSGRVLSSGSGKGGAKPGEEEEEMNALLDEMIQDRVQRVSDPILPLPGPAPSGPLPRPSSYHVHNESMTLGGLAGPGPGPMSLGGPGGEAQQRLSAPAAVDTDERSADDEDAPRPSSESALQVDRTLMQFPAPAGKSPLPSPIPAS